MRYAVLSFVAFHVHGLFVRLPQRAKDYWSDEWIARYLRELGQ